MKKALLICLCLAAALTASAKVGKTVIPASDGRITYIGRVEYKADSVSFDWSGTVVKIRFKGRKLEMNCKDTHANWFNVWVDKDICPKEDAVLAVKESGKYTIVSGLADAEHEVILQKRTEGEQGRFSAVSFTTDGSFLKASGRKARHIEFVGDSYTCGYGTEASSRNEPFRAAEENCNLAYDNIIGRFFDADVNLVAHSGMGIIRNYGDNRPETNMVKKYGQLYDMQESPKWAVEMASYRPDIVVVYLGTNDFSTGKQPSLNSWCNNYRELLGRIRRNYGKDVPILCVASKASGMMGMYVETAVERAGIENVSWTSIQEDAHNSESDLGASWHPNYSGQRKVACCMIPYIATLTGWELPLKAVE